MCVWYLACVTSHPPLQVFSWELSCHHILSSCMCNFPPPVTGRFTGIVITFSLGAILCWYGGWPCLFYVFGKVHSKILLKVLKIVILNSCVVSVVHLVTILACLYIIWRARNFHKLHSCVIFPFTLLYTRGRLFAGCLV